ncbi:hypothetical protein SIN8267_02069 [Sinobacterium norvegicum]|uniref:MaoC-like domain-containing protein n=1 Tax=Sinobacterium norvegicum TaxID=1641715 RepID=A0ABN8EIS8_9GAMM|nr:MaoC/PaaZ C-terminal domain-containing protein [Sinobacterium norvegicum]CAH0991954.1 hypothetical protein SIN8267_02069 [Sinobacterium norvegicum]
MTAENSAEQIEYFHAIALDRVHRTRDFTLTEDDIISYASEWNPEPYHIDVEAAKQSRIGRVFAAGPHLIAISVKLTNERRPRPASVAGLGWDELRFKVPAFPDDQLYVETFAAEKRLSQSKPDTGIVRYVVNLKNQRDEVVLSYSVSTLVEVGPA